MCAAEILFLYIHCQTSTQIMHQLKFFPVLLCLLFTASPCFSQTDSLDAYINRLKKSASVGGTETAFLSIGSDFMYAQEYIEAGNFSSAEYNLKAILRRDNNHPYANYQLGYVLMKQKDQLKANEAGEYFEKAFTAIPSLKHRFSRDFPGSKDPEPVKESEGNNSMNENEAEDPANMAKGLDQYIERIKRSRATGGSETNMLSAGLDAFYGIEYYEKGEYGSAATNFGLSLSKEPDNAYVNYLYAISLNAQNKTSEAGVYLKKAIRTDPGLLDRFKKEAPVAISKWKKSEDAKKLKSTPTTPVSYGGALYYGNYTCHVNVWNGPNASPAYRSDYQGYFQLRKDGTYRWLDDGSIGKYRYDPATGKITWLSGFFKSHNIRSTMYQRGTTVSQISVQYSETYKWECGCKKK